MANTKIYTDEMEAVKAFVHNVNELAKINEFFPVHLYGIFYSVL